MEPARKAAILLESMRTAFLDVGRDHHAGNCLRASAVRVGLVQAAGMTGARRWGVALQEPARGTQRRLARCCASIEQMDDTMRSSWMQPHGMHTCRRASRLFSLETHCQVPRMPSSGEHIRSHERRYCDMCPARRATRSSSFVTSPSLSMGRIRFWGSTTDDGLNPFSLRHKVCDNQLNFRN